MQRFQEHSHWLCPVVLLVVVSANSAAAQSVAAQSVAAQSAAAQSVAAQSAAAQSAAAQSAAAQSAVQLLKTESGFKLLRGGSEYRIKGAGGKKYLAELSAAGGNSIRTWDAKNLGQVLDQAHSHGLTVTAGLWMGHQRHGFNYQDETAVVEQLDEKLAVVRQFKDHPALLMWNVGNEAEGDGSDPSVWYAINHVAREIQAIDSMHPTMTVIAELGPDASKVKSIERFCPNVDIIGVNAYGGVETVYDRYAKAGSSKPYIVTEHGPLGPWEVGKASTGAPEEWTSTEKAAFYAKGYIANAVDHPGQCLGTYAFMWGHKQETTATWFGMLLPDGSRLGAVDTLSELWTGDTPANQCPELSGFKLSRQGRIKPGEQVQVTVLASDPDEDALEFRWVLRSDSGTIGEGGDPQEDESEIPEAVRFSGNTATVTAPESGGGYRLFAYVRDDHGGAAVGNVPIHVDALRKLKSEMPIATLPLVVYDGETPQGVYVPAGYMGNADAIKMTADCAEQPHSGTSCLKVQYNNAGAWGGVLWQSPPGDWDGQLPGGANLTGATHLEFWARGSEGSEKVNFLFGVLDGNQPYVDTAKAELKDVELSKQWQKFSLPLADLDMRQIKTGFGWSLEGQGKPVTFFLDDIRYVSQK